jgi:hypothetical protein
MEKILIFPEHENNSSIEEIKNMPYCYLHGQLENEIGFDLFGISNHPQNWDFDNTNTIPKGIYEGTYNAKDCVLYLWQSKMFGLRGLCVYKDDIDANMFAYKHYFTDAVHL